MNYHFIGISGAGMSALAGIIEGYGNKISGSDLKTTGHRAENVSGADIVVYTPAITESSPGWIELKTARKEGIRVLRYDELLGEITNSATLIAVSGMHGKSTTTAMIARIFEDAGLDPTVLVGAYLPEWENKNFRIGKKDLWIVEADDYEKKFLTLNPFITVTTNIDFEHVDTYKNIDDAIGTFAELYKKTKNRLIVNFDDENVHSAIDISGVEKKAIWFGIGAKEFNLDILPILRVIGQHNKLNAMASIACADVFGITRDVSHKTLSNYQGIARRQEFIGEKDEVMVFDDYAHHPTEIKATINAFREEFPDQRLVFIFEPHQHKRVNMLFKDFTSSFYGADLVLITDVFGVAGRESNVAVDSRDLVSEIQNNGVESVYVGNIQSAKEKLGDILKPNDILITMGAGSITNLGREWVSE